jgi:riboflavin synthase
MFTGIIETTGLVKDMILNGSNRIFWIESPISGMLRIDQSIAHNGACLTVDETGAGRHRVTAVKETLEKTELNRWKPGTRINLERCLSLQDRLDGHFVQGHIDTVGECIGISDENGSWKFSFSFPKKFGELIIEKGSIAVNGISLTAFDVKKSKFSVAIIPYTYEHTSIRDLKKGSQVNLEFDLIGKYINRSLSLK